MVTAKNHIVDVGETKVSQKGSEQLSSAPVRVRRDTKAKLVQLLRRANKDRLGRRVKPDDLIGFAPGLITDDHLTTICDGTLSNKDRLELLYRRTSKERRGLTKDEFFAHLASLSGLTARSRGEKGRARYACYKSASGAIFYLLLGFVC